MSPLAAAFAHSPPLSATASSPLSALLRNSQAQRHSLRIGYARAPGPTPKSHFSSCRNSQPFSKGRLGAFLTVLLAGALPLGDRNQDSAMVTNVPEAYKPLRLHPKLFDEKVGWNPGWFLPNFYQALQEDTKEGWDKIITTKVDGLVFSMPMFRPEFCDKMIEEVDNFAKSGLPALRPNSMNRYGLILNGIGMRGMFDLLSQQVLARVATHYFNGNSIDEFDGHHTFIVRYKDGEDRGLDMHVDDSDVTFNICLGKEFTGAPLVFCGQFGQPSHRKHMHTATHVKGHCIFHLGRHRHGAGDIGQGERMNLIIWNHSSQYRSSEAYKNMLAHRDFEREEGPPDPVCLSYTHDRDYGNFKEYTKENEEHRGKGWCPPRHAEYQGFSAERPMGGEV